MKAKLFRSLLVVVVVTMFLSSAKAQVKWMSFEDGLALAKSTKKKIIVDMYTDWCGWCKHMDKTTFSQPIIARIIQDYYIPIKFNAEQRNAVLYNGKLYKYISKGNGGYHELAVEFVRDQLSFPTLVFLDEQGNMIQPLPGYQDARGLEVILSYFARNYHKSTPWSSYQRTYQPLRQDNMSVPVKW
ncbi:MAG: DUF255 domain-containing protein [Saprospiraceae bacterium]|jgi:thioredoxin-related protein|nr:DUF255 domain-containing protein [Saprospiraceae bacterium]